jgi:3-hydroxybutyryl-CoA dehydratase
MSGFPCPVEEGFLMSRSLVLSAQDIRAGAAFLDDRNPLHTDAARAAASRFGELIASGPHIAGLHAALAATDLSAFGAPLGVEFTVRYVAPVRAGGLTMTWTVVAVEPKPALDGHFLRLRGEVRSEGDQLLISADGLVLLARSP